MNRYPRFGFELRADQKKRYDKLRKRLVDEPGLVNISEEMRMKLDEILDRYVPESEHKQE